MTKEELNQKVQQVVTNTKEALQLVYDSLNTGQQQKILKDEKIKELFTRYNVEI